MRDMIMKAPNAIEDNYQNVIGRLHGNKYDLECTMRLWIQSTILNAKCAHGFEIRSHVFKIRPRIQDTIADFESDRH